MSKRIPSEFTVVLNLKLEVADLISRKTVQKTAVAEIIAKGQKVAFNRETVTELTLENIKQFVSITSFTKFDVEVTSGGSTLTQTCNGLFVFRGVLDKVVVRPNTNVTEDLVVEYAVS